RLDAVGLDLLLAREAELLLHLDLDREPVAVPPRFAGDIPPAHRVEAGIEVLEQPAPHVMDAGTAVRGGCTLVEDPFRRTLAASQALGERVVDGPSAQPPRVERGEIELAIDGLERHPAHDTDPAFPEFVWIRGRAGMPCHHESRPLGRALLSAPFRSR